MIFYFKFFDAVFGSKPQRCSCEIMADDALFFERLGGGNPETPERSTSDRLAIFHTAPAQLLNAGGSNGVAGCSKTRYWKILSTGGKGFPYRYEGCDHRLKRQGVGATRALGSLNDSVSVIMQSGCNLEAVLDKAILAQAREEGKRLLPHLEKLNGRGVPTGSGEAADVRRQLFGSQKRKAENAVVIPTPAEVETSAQAIAASKSESSLS